MDKPVIIIELPELDKENADKVGDFLEHFTNAFVNHFYFGQSYFKPSRGEENKDVPACVFNNKISHEVILEDLLTGLKTEKDFTRVLNFLGHATDVIHILQKNQKEMCGI